MSQQHTRDDALLSLAILGARADQEADAAERDELEELARGMAAELPTGADLERLEEYAEALRGPDTRREAFATALAVCRADGKLSNDERAFLRRLGSALELGKSDQRALRADADALVDTAGGAVRMAAGDDLRDERVDDMIRNTAILAGALELLPQTLGTVGIVALQVRLVQRIARQYGEEPSTGDARRFLGTAGVGLAGQALELFLRRKARGLQQRGFLGRLSGGLAGPAFTFATTWSLGQLAQRHYSGGEPLDQASMRSTLTDLFGRARELAADSEEAIRHRAAGFGLSDLVTLLRR